MLGSFQLSLDWRGSENFDLRTTHNVYSTTLHRLHSENSSYLERRILKFAGSVSQCVPGTCFNELLTPDFIWFKKYVLGTQGWSLAVKMNAVKCKSVADGWENRHLPFNLVQEITALAHEWTKEQQPLFSTFIQNAFPRRHGHGQPCVVALCHWGEWLVSTVRYLPPALHLTNICHKVQCTCHGFWIWLQIFVMRWSTAPLHLT